MLDTSIKCKRCNGAKMIRDNNFNNKWCINCAGTGWIRIKRTTQTFDELRGERDKESSQMDINTMSKNVLDKESQVLGYEESPVSASVSLEKQSIINKSPRKKRGRPTLYKRPVEVECNEY